MRKIDRFDKYMAFKGLNDNKVTNDLELSVGTLGKSRKEGRDVSARVIELILNYYCDLSRVWLLTGEGEMLKPNSESRPKSSGSDSSEKVSEYRLVPLIQIDSVGGMHSSNIIDCSEQYVIQRMPFTEAQDGDVAILQSGNSMYPTIPSGSALLIREVVDWQEYFGYGNIYVLWLRDGRRITKEIRRYDADPHNYVWCVSYNPDVADEELPRSMIRGVWKVIKYVADFGW